MNQEGCCQAPRARDASDAFLFLFHSPISHYLRVPKQAPLDLFLSLCLQMNILAGFFFFKRWLFKRLELDVMLDAHRVNRGIRKMPLFGIGYFLLFNIEHEVSIIHCYF